jgi:hypothetical protein
MKPLGGEHVGLDQRMQGRERRRRCSHLVGQRRDRELDALAAVTLALPVERLMLPELLEHDGR